MAEQRAVTRRALVGAAGAAGAVGLLASCAAGTTGLGAVADPLVRQRADPHVSRTPDGGYLFTASVPEYDRVVLRAAPTLAGLTAAKERTLWRRPASGAMGGYVWAPELHRIDGRWYVYFAAGDSDDPFRIRPYVLEADGADPMTAAWSVRGRIETAFDAFALDATTFALHDARYLVWAQAEPGIATNSNLYIARMSDPSRLTGVQTRIAVPTESWETRGFSVNEGPAVLVRDGRILITFSASATDANYCMGLLTADADADPLDAASWVKSPEPVFASDAAAGVFGPGHNSFTTVPDGRGGTSDAMIYHAREYERIEGDPLLDPNRHARVQEVRWRPDGSPDFGTPQPFSTA